MKFIKNLKELNTAVNEILGIFYRLVVSSGRLESAEKLQSWREAVKEMRRVLESVRNTANRTDNVPLLLIGVDRFGGAARIFHVRASAGANSNGYARTNDPTNE
ncbi:hypothetical protein BKA83DRAFT_4129870 [Pisolithus microcarpus]|nr:hypothetical protein BKA83DRAFT_4129870 [Pisolithus microcarpus]